jgi:hypothetical protein
MHSLGLTNSSMKVAVSFPVRCVMYHLFFFLSFYWDFQKFHYVFYEALVPSDPWLANFKSGVLVSVEFRSYLRTQVRILGSEKAIFQNTQLNPSCLFSQSGIGVVGMCMTFVFEAIYTELWECLLPFSPSSVVFQFAVQKDKNKNSQNCNFCPPPPPLWLWKLDLLHWGRNISWWFLLYLPNKCIC